MCTFLKQEEVESFNGLQIDISKYNALSNQCKEMQDKCEQYERALNRLNQKLKKIDEEVNRHRYYCVFKL